MIDVSERSSVGRRRRWWIFLAPLLAYVALLAWAFASPIGAGPDDDYHLISTWCADGGSNRCLPGSKDNTRIVPSAMTEIACFAQHPDRSAACQEGVWPRLDGETVQTTRGNFVGEYPPVFYAVMRLFVTDDVQVSGLILRAINAALFVGLATALAVLLPASRRRTLLWAWLTTLVPLGLFLIASNNPSGWAITGVGTAFLALLGWFESQGRRRWILAALYFVGVLMAAGARGDGAVYVTGATVAVLILTVSRTRHWAFLSIVPTLGVVLAIILFSTSGQTGVASTGFGGAGGAAGDPANISGFSLAAYNLLMLPFLWTGIWGTWGLGWLDTQLPAIVPWSATAAFVSLGFRGLGRLSWRKAIALAGVLCALVVIPVYVLTVSGNTVGTNLQPRYLLPLIVLFAFVLLIEPGSGSDQRLTRVQCFALVGALAIANTVSLQVNIRRYVTGVAEQGANLDEGAEWWWSGLPVGPTAVWAIGSLAFVGLLAVLWNHLRGSHLATPGPALVSVRRSPQGSPSA